MNQLQRINARLNEDVNEEWTCDRGKFGHDYVSVANRLTRPMVKRDGEFVPIEWNEAYDLLINKVRGAGPNLAGIGGAVSTNEDNFLFQRLFREVLKCSNIDHRMSSYVGPTRNPPFERLGYH